MSALSWNCGMCTNALNCTHSPLIDGAGLRGSTGQILQWRKTQAHLTGLNPVQNPGGFLVPSPVTAKFFLFDLKVDGFFGFNDCKICQTRR